MFNSIAAATWDIEFYTSLLDFFFYSRSELKEKVLALVFTSSFRADL
jgi:hypothetical protein